MGEQGDEKLQEVSVDNSVRGISDIVRLGWEQIAKDGTARNRFLEFVGLESLGMLGLATLRESGLTAERVLEKYNLPIPDSFIFDFSIKMAVDLIDNTPSEVFASLGLIGFIGANLSKRELSGGVSNGRLLAAYTKLMINKAFFYKDVEM